MKTTYEKIKSFNPCGDGWKLLLKNTNPEINMTKEIDLMEIFRSNGIKDAIWALRCFDYLDYCLFLADVAESVLPIFEKKYPDDDRPRKAVQAIRDYKAGKITNQDMKNACAACAADAAADAAAADAAADAAYAAAAAAYAAAADAAADAAAADAAADAAYAAAAAAYADAAYAYAADDRQKKWDEIEQIFVKHFGGTK